MQTMIKCAESIYDIMAICAKKLIETTKKFSFDPWKFDYDSEINTKIHDSIEYYVDKLNGSGRSNGLALLKRQLSRLMPDNNCNIEEWQNVCYSIIKSIDECILPDVKKRSIEDDYCIIYNSLNTMENESIRIIPRIRDTFIKHNDKLILKDPNSKPNKKEYTLFRDENDFYASDIDRKMQYYMIWGKEYVDRYPLNIVRIDKDSEIGKVFRNKKSLNIAIAPFTCNSIKNILNIEYEKESFFVKNMKKDAEDELKERYKKIYKQCCERNIDFLIFPEMLVSREMIEECKQHYMKSGPIFVINGTISDNKTNVSVITDYNKKDIFSYYKKNGYIDTSNGTRYKESLNNILNKTYYILELEDFGRIGICICKDLNDENVLMFHKLIRTNILFVPAFSKSLSLNSEAQNIADMYNCITVFANSCSARCGEWGTEQDIGFIALPAKMGSSNKSLIYKYSAKDCISICQNECTCKVFSIDFDKISKYNDKYSFYLKEDHL